MLIIYYTIHLLSVTKYIYIFVFPSNYFHEVLSPWETRERTIEYEAFLLNKILKRIWDK